MLKWLNALIWFNKDLHMILEKPCFLTLFPIFFITYLKFAECDDKSTLFFRKSWDCCPPITVIIYYCLIIFDYIIIILNSYYYIVWLYYFFILFDNCLIFCVVFFSMFTFSYAASCELSLLDRSFSPRHCHCEKSCENFNIIDKNNF